MGDTRGAFPAKIFMTYCGLSLSTGNLNSHNRGHRHFYHNELSCLAHLKTCFPSQWKITQSTGCRCSSTLVFLVLTVFVSKAIHITFMNKMSLTNYTFPSQTRPTTPLIWPLLLCKVFFTLACQLLRKWCFVKIFSLISCAPAKQLQQTITQM